MKFNLIIILFFFSSCAQNLPKLDQKKSYTAKGFAYIFNDVDYENKIIKGKLNNEIMEISQQNLKTGTLVKIINIKNKKSIVLKNKRRIKYPEFYKILISKPVAEKLDLNKEFPVLEVIEIKKNKSFVAEKAKIFNEEKKVTTNAPVASVEISNISKNKSKINKEKLDDMFIHIGTFYSIDTANFLKKRIIQDVPGFDIEKITIQKKNNKKTLIISGPYSAINSLKNDYIQLKTFGFEDLDIFFNE